jgi:hypothetical protein
LGPEQLVFFRLIDHYIFILAHRFRHPVDFKFDSLPVELVLIIFIPFTSKTIAIYFRSPSCCQLTSSLSVYV